MGSCFSYYNYCATLFIGLVAVVGLTITCLVDFLDGGILNLVSVFKEIYK
jgi:hypothetical protein